jgi:ankyrin repeat protein
VKLLLEKNANIEAKDNYGGTALKAAERKRNTEIVKLLKEKGAH